MKLLFKIFIMSCISICISSLSGAQNRNVRIALVQMSSPVGKKKENTIKTIEWVKKAKAKNAKVVCFPELNLTGHAGDAAMVRDSEKIPGGSSFSALEEAAKDLDIYICAGISETENDVCYNTFFITGPDGYIGKQRKLHLSRDEYYYFRSGTEMKCFDLAFGKLVIIICYDNEIPEVPRCYALKGAELVLAPHAARYGDMPDNEGEIRETVKRQKEHFSMIQSCRAYDNGFFVALCNTVGNSSEGLSGVIANHAGGCMLFDPWGKIIKQSETGVFSEEMVIADIYLSEVSKRRNEICFNLKTRRPELYKIITSQTE